MQQYSPPESVHALDVAKLRDPRVTFWSAWVGEQIAGISALKLLDAERGELKSMRVADAFVGKGVGRALLNQMLQEARTRGLKSLWIETGTNPSFAPATKLYESAGFVPCAPFESYVLDPYSQYMTLVL
jgi:putative acetyltransferase